MSQSKTKQCQNCKSKFTIEPEDFEFYKKIDVPEPTFCPDCRVQRRLVWRNEKNLYKIKCDYSGEEIFSGYYPGTSYKIYEHDIWWSDKWDPMEYGKDYNFEKPFFEQMKELFFHVPIPSRSIQKLVNSDYSNNAGFLKNCYLIFYSGNSEDCAYGTTINEVKDSFDNTNLEKCELCYGGFMLNNCYKTFFSSNCEGCQNIVFCNDCVDCSNCFGCVNLKHKKYYIFNEPYSKEEYFEKLKKFDIGSYQNKEEILKKAKEFWLKKPVKYMHGRKNVNVSGEHIYNSKNVHQAYIIRSGENLKYCQFLGYVASKDCYDYNGWGESVRLVYDVCLCGDGMNRVKFSFDCWPNCRDLEYCVGCHSSTDLFGCTGLRHKQYCIFNKQYSKKEYQELVPKIKKHMNEMPYIDLHGNTYKYGEFFPPEFSPSAYNETMAHDFFPLTKEGALQKRYTWYDKPKGEYESTISAVGLVDHIKDVEKDVLNEVIECANELKETCNGSGVFKILSQELEFYKKYNLPLPRICPDCRHHERLKQRNPMKLWKRQCMKKGCNTKFQTSYASDRKEIVYCEQCYQKEIE